MKIGVKQINEEDSNDTEVYTSTFKMLENLILSFKCAFYIRSWKKYRYIDYFFYEKTIKIRLLVNLCEIL